MTDFPTGENLTGFLMLSCFDKAVEIIDDTLILLKNKGGSRNALGLYLFALEETGKGLILKDRFESKSRILESWIFGRGRPSKKITSHEAKFERAKQEVPPQCYQVLIHTKLSIYDDRGSQVGDVIKLGENVIGLEKYLSGLFSDLSNHEEFIILDQEIRTGCFYVDYPDGTKAEILAIDENTLQVALKELKTFVDDYRKKFIYDKNQRSQFS